MPILKKRITPKRFRVSPELKEFRKRESYLQELRQVRQEQGLEAACALISMKPRF